MKIILREHVEHLGDRGDEVNVAAGYARNYLLPKGLAYRSGAGNAKQIEDQKRAWAVREARSENAAQALGTMIGKLELTVRRAASAEVYYVLQGQGTSVGHGECIDWRTGDALSFPGGDAVEHTARRSRSSAGA